jgi:hypothetical protein
VLGDSAQKVDGSHSLEDLQRVPWAQKSKKKAQFSPHEDDLIDSDDRSSAGQYDVSLQNYLEAKSRPPTSRGQHF